MKLINNIIIFASYITVGLSQSWIQNQLLDRNFNQAVSSYNDGRYIATVSILKKIISNGDSDYSEAALFLLIKSQINLGKSSEAKELAKVFFAKYSSGEYLKNTMESLGDLYVNDSNYESAYRMYFRSKILSGDANYRLKIDKKLSKLIQMRLSINLIDELLIMEIDQESRNIHLIARANTLIFDGMPDAAAHTLNQIDTSSMPDVFSQLFEKLLRASYEPSSPLLTVGIALPLTGSRSAEGKAFLDGFFKGEKNLLKSKQRLSVLVRDTRSNDLEAVKIAKNIEEIDQVKVLVCPLSDRLALAVVSALSESNVPILLPNKHAEDLSLINTKSFLLNSDLATEGITAARYVVLNLGLDSIAVLAPANHAGEIQADAFINEVDRLGGNIVATEWYSGEPKNLKRQFTFLREVAFELLPNIKNYDEALGMEIDSLDALFDVSIDDFFDLPKSDKKKLSSSDSSKVILSTIQAIYMPIRDTDLEYLGPQIPMYNLDTKIIGNSSWQDLTILQKDNISPHLKGMSIITNFYIENTDSSDQNNDYFFEFYLGYNTAKLLTTLTLENQSRKEIYSSLKKLDIYNGIGYYYSPSTENEHVNSSFQLLEFTGRDFSHLGFFKADSLRLVERDNP